MKYILSLMIALLCLLQADAQRQKIDSLNALLNEQQTDSGRVICMYKLAVQYSTLNTDTALIFSQQALSLARKTSYTEGESLALGIMANIIGYLGNYPLALELYLNKLKLEEKRNNPQTMANVLINIGLIYVLQEEYKEALPYYRRADSIISANKVDALRYYIAQNMGDLYDRLNNVDTAFFYFKTALQLAIDNGKKELIGSSLVGLAHSYRKKGEYALALDSYRRSISILQETTNEETLCEAKLGLADLYRRMDRPDSAAYHAKASFDLANKAGFLSQEMDATVFLKDLYSKVNNVDSAFRYLNHMQLLKDSLESKDRIRQMQVLTSNEQTRQFEIAEQKRKEKEEREKQLQLLLIGIFIPGFFMITLLLSRRKIHIKVVRFLGVLSLLILFEYLTLWLHPWVMEVTHHTPIYELMIFVSIAAILIPTHHRIEHWLIEALTGKHFHPESGSVKLNIKRLRMKKPSNPAPESAGE